MVRASFLLQVFVCCVFTATTFAFKHVLAHDHGLYYAAIPAVANEWNRRNLTVGDGNSALVHVWLQCIDYVLRAYYLVERETAAEIVVAKNHQAAHSFKFLVNSTAPKQQGACEPYGGGHFLTALSTLHPPHATIDIGIEGWSHYFSFPLRLCLASPAFEPKRVVHSGVFQPKIDATTVEAYAKHILYHRHVWQSDNYELVMHEALMDLFLQNDVIRREVLSGHVSLLSTGAAPVDVKHYQYYWQYVYQNTAFLRHWKRNTLFAYIDVDEYLVSDGNLQQFDNIFSTVSVLILQPTTVLCDTCSVQPGDEIPSQISSRKSHKWYVQRHDVSQQKCLVNSSSLARCIAIHYVTGASEVRAPPELFLAHFVNLFTPRAQVNFSRDDTAAFNGTIMQPFLDIL